MSRPAKPRTRLVPRECASNDDPKFPPRRIFQSASSNTEITLRNPDKASTHPSTSKTGPRPGKESISVDFENDVVDAMMQDDLVKRLDGVTVSIEFIKKQNEGRQQRILDGITDTVCDAKLVITSQNERLQQLEQENIDLANEVRHLKKKLGEQKAELSKKTTQLQRFVKLCREMQLAIMNFVGAEPTDPSTPR